MFVRLIINNEWEMYLNTNDCYLMIMVRDRIIIFSLDERIVNLSEADTWFCKGNFKLSPEFCL